MTAFLSSPTPTQLNYSVNALIMHQIFAILIVTLHCYSEMARNGLGMAISGEDRIDSTLLLFYWAEKRNLTERVIYLNANNSDKLV